MRKIEIYVGGYLRSTSHRNITMPRKSTMYVFGETRVSKAAPGTITAPPRYVYVGTWTQCTLVAGNINQSGSSLPPNVGQMLTMPDQIMPDVGQLPPRRPRLPWLSEEIYPSDDGGDPDYECDLCEPTGRW